MRPLSALALLAFAMGIAVLAYGVAIGEGQLHLVLIFPVVTGTGPTAFVGILLIAAAFVLGFLSFTDGWLTRISESVPPPVRPAPPDPTETRAKRFGGVVFLGPFPIVFGSDQQVAKWMIVVAVILAILLIVLFLTSFAPFLP